MREGAIKMAGRWHSPGASALGFVDDSAGAESDGGLGAALLSALDRDAAAAIAASKDTAFREWDEDRLRGATGVDRPSGT